MNVLNRYSPQLEFLVSRDSVAVADEVEVSTTNLNTSCFSVSSHQVVLELIGLEVGLLIVHFTSDRNEKVVVSGRIDSRRPRSREKMLNVVSNLQKHAATSHICPTCPSTWSCRRQSSDARSRRRAGFFVRPDLVTGQSGNRRGSTWQKAAGGYSTTLNYQGHSSQPSDSSENQWTAS